VAVIVVLAMLGLDAIAAEASPARSGATYRGNGSQPHFVLMGPGSPNGTFIVQFRVAGNGRRLIQINVWGLVAVCGPRADGYQQPTPNAGSARIRRNGTFQAEMPNISDPGSPVLLTGRFLSHGRARGAVTYRGRAGSRGCNLNGVWTAQIKPAPPPVQPYVGTTSEGTTVTFELTIEPHPHVLRFNFGVLQYGLCGSVEVATGPEPGPPFDQFELPVDNQSFSGEYQPPDRFVDITGSFDAQGDASGTVQYGDRSGCNMGMVPWTAQPTG
jgi:hypothetical protein